MSFGELSSTVIDIWTGGGWLMIPLALLAFAIYVAGFELVFYFSRYSFDQRDKNEWGHWLDQPEEGHGTLGAIIRHLTTSNHTLETVRSYIHELRQAYVVPVQRRVLFLSILVTIAPLTGLLGTVMGMILTFNGLASNRGAALDVVAGGISQALITTQTGLIIAIPGYILVHHAKRRCQQLDGFFTEMEARTAQKYEQQKPT